MEALNVASVQNVDCELNVNDRSSSQWSVNVPIVGTLIFFYIRILIWMNTNMILTCHLFFFEKWLV